jgi:hypothetical protein
LEFSGSSEPGVFMVGSGRSVITPPAGYPICGPEHAERTSLGVADDLLAKVLVVESAGVRAAIVGLDVWGLTAAAHEDIVSAVAEAVAAPVDHVWLSVSGNGTSPCLWSRHSAYQRYAAYLPDLVSGAAVIAANALEPASISTAAARLPDVSTLLEGPGRPGDEALFTVAFNDADGNGVGRMVNFSCPATISGPVPTWTSDFPGYAMWAVEQAGGGLSLFAQGASADVRPFDWYEGNASPSHAQRSEADVQAFGLLLATQAAQSTSSALPRRNAPIAAAVDVEVGLRVLRIGPAVFVSARKSQPTRFSRHIRRDLPGSTVIVTANLCGDAFGEVSALDYDLQQRAVELARQTGAN